MGLGEEFAHALGRKDAAAMRLLLRPDVDFRAYGQPDGDRIGWLRVMCAAFQAIP